MYRSKQRVEFLQPFTGSGKKLENMPGKIDNILKVQ